MKYRRYLTVLAVLISAACAKEEITEETKPSLPEDAVLFSGSVERMAGTRTSYEDTEESIIVSWAEGDRIGVFGELDGTVYASNYGYRNSTEGQTASFSAIDADKVIRKAEGSHTFYACYPYTAGDDIDVESVPVTLPAEQTFDPALPQGQFSALDFMYAKAEGVTFSGSEQEDYVVPLAFSHLFSVLEIRIATDRPAIVNKLIFSCDEASEAVSLGTGSTVSLKTGEITAADPTNTVVLNGSQGTMPGSLTVWQMFITPGHENRTFTVKAVINGNEYTVVEAKAAPEGGFLAGDTYRLTNDNLEVNAADATSLDLSINGTANTYIISEPATTYTFNAKVMGNGIPRSFTWTESDGTEITRSYSDLGIEPEDVKVVWYNTPKTAEGYVDECPIVLESVSYDKATGLVTFITPRPFVTGNVLLAAYDAAGTILWSWNIWAAGEGYSAEATARNAGRYVIMDRNLGATAGPEVMNTADDVRAVGHYYQWGRKDPFPAVAEYGATSETGVVAVSEGNTGSWGLPSHTPIDELKSANQTLGFSDLIFGTDAIENCCQLKTEIGDSFTTEQSLPVSIKYPYRWMSYEGSNARWNEYVWSAPYNTLSTTEERFSWRYLWGNPDPDAAVEETDNVKTIYDPCPPGWKVMSRLAWDFVDNGLEELTNGYYSPVYDLYFPFTGQRQAGFGGSLIQAVDMHYLHTCNVGGTAQWEVIRNMLSNSLTYTAAGHNVRCVKEDMVVADLPHRGAFCVLIGDSITRTWNSYDGGFFTSNNLLAKGADGQTSQQILDRFYADVITNTPPVVHIMCGINDIANNDGANRTNEGIFANIKAMAEMAVSYGIKVMIGSTPPANYIWWVDNAEQWNEEHPDTAQRVIDLNEDLKAYCEENGFIYVDYWTALVDTDDDNLNGLKEEYQVDSVHPNTDCFQTVMGPIFLDALEEALYIPDSAAPGGQLDDFDREDITLN